MTRLATKSVLFSEELFKPGAVAFDHPDRSSDGGAILLKAIDTPLPSKPVLQMAPLLGRRLEPSKPLETYFEAGRYPVRVRG